jgi:hypothetical protein
MTSVMTGMVTNDAALALILDVELATWAVETHHGSC